MAPFFIARRNSNPVKAKEVDRRARWGIVLVALGFSLVWQGRFWERSVAEWRVAVSLLFLLLADLSAWTSTRALGRHWRMDAGLNADHSLVTSGPYGIVRHPIYTSMLCLLLSTGLMIGTLPLLAIAIGLFVLGTEIRVRIEEKLLASRFGDRFSDYRRRVPAYIPFLR